MDNDQKVKELEIKLQAEIQRSETYKWFNFSFMCIIIANLAFYQYNLRYISMFLNLLGFILLILGAYNFLKIEKIMITLNKLKENDEKLKSDELDIDKNKKENNDNIKEQEKVIEENSISDDDDDDDDDDEDE